MARTIKTVKATGGDYTTLAAALAAVPDITGITPDTINGKPIAYEIQCFASAAGDIYSYALAGTTDSGHWLRIVCPAGEGHAGFWDATKYYIEETRNYYYALAVHLDYVMVEGLQVRATGLGDCGLRISKNSIILNTITIGTDNALVITGGTVDFNNCIVDGGSTFNEQVGGTITFENCTIVRNNAYGWVVNGGTCAMKNTYVGGCTTQDVLGTITATTCKSGDGSLGTAAAFSAVTFLSVTPGEAGYLHPVEVGALDDAGTDLSADAAWWLDAVDISGAARTGTWGIGAWEAVAVEAGSALQYAIPDEDILDGGWLNELGTNANLHQSIDDVTTDDSTYIQSSASPTNDVCRVGLTPIKVPVAGDVLMQVRVKLV